MLWLDWSNKETEVAFPIFESSGAKGHSKFCALKKQIKSLQNLKTLKYYFAESELVMSGILSCFLWILTISFGGIEKRMYLCIMKKVFSGREIEFSARENLFFAWENRFCGAEIEFLGRKETFDVKSLDFIR